MAARNAGQVRLAESSPAPPERWLQQLWRHQRIRRGQLQTIDGRRLTVLHPGFWNRGAGPDFRDAMIQWEGGEIHQGDVEIDVITSGWHGHCHAGNPAYRDVVLHVVWTTPPDGVHRPVLALLPHLDAPLGTLATWLDGLASRQLPESTPGRCSPLLHRRDPRDVDDLLNQAALHRLEWKAGRFEARARDVGWAQALFEGLIEGLGYRNNTWPMRRIAEVHGPHGELSRAGIPLPADKTHQHARMLGLANLLPNDLPDGPARRLARDLWDQWWRERHLLRDWILPKSLWRTGGLRPLNHPQRRLILACAWLSNPSLPESLTAWLTQRESTESPASNLARLLTPESTDDFWQLHPSLHSTGFRTPQPLIGLPRLADLAMNMLLPWLWARSLRTSDQALRSRLQQIYLEWPRSEDNARLRLARQRLFGDAVRGRLRTAAHQQGLLQITEDFCSHFDPRCQGCPLPDLLRPPPHPLFQPPTIPAEQLPGPC